MTWKYVSVNKGKLLIHIVQIKSTATLFQKVLVSPSLETHVKTVI